MERKSIIDLAASQLSVNEMISVRGGDGDTSTVITTKVGEGIEIIL